jgi:hypothetical protein
MHIKGFRIILLVAIPLIFNQCVSEYVSDGRTVCFEQEVRPLLNSNCTQSGCHNSFDVQSGADFTTPEGILKYVHPGNYRKSEIYNAITAPFNSMPPAPYDRLSRDKITTIALWIEQGAHTDSCMAQPCDTFNVGFSNSIVPIIQTYCNGCHSGNNYATPINYSSYAGVKATVDDGRLLGSLYHRSGFIPMPQNGDQLPSCKIAIIQRWVDSGAPNN